MEACRSSTAAPFAVIGSPFATASPARSIRTRASPRNPSDRPELPDVRVARMQLGAAAGRASPNALTPEMRGARRLAKLHARHDLLSDVAAFLEIDPVELVKARLVRIGVGEGVVLAALGNHAAPDDGRRSPAAVASRQPSRPAHCRIAAAGAISRHPRPASRGSAKTTPPSRRAASAPLAPPQSAATASAAVRSAISIFARSL